MSWAILSNVIHPRSIEYRNWLTFEFMIRNVRNSAFLVLFHCIICLCTKPCEAQVRSGANEFVAFWDSLNTVFTTPGTTILSAQELETFHGIPFFQYDSSYCVVAKVKRIKGGKPVEMLTSGARRPIYVPIAQVKFKANGKRQKLVLYTMQNPSKPEYADHVMLAFSDLTNGHETYGGGRYLDFKLQDLKAEMIIDFNFAYNPYCAYVDRYACVIPPPENRLEIAIKAGARVHTTH
jgi:uncharacterized protein